MTDSLIKYSVSTHRRKLFSGIILLFLALFAVATVDFLSIITFCLFLLFVSIFNVIIFRSLNLIDVFLVFFFYTVLSIIIYWSQYYQFPVNHGCTGASIHGGTDDLFYFQEAVTNGISYRGDRSNSMHPYSVFLRLFFKIIRLYKIPGLLDLLFVNIFASSFIPILTKQVAVYLKFDRKCSQLAFIFSLICPIMIMNGLVLVRDGWTAMLLILSLYSLFNRKIILLAVSIILTFYLRVSSAGIILLFVVIILLFTDRSELPKYKLENRVLYIFIGIVFVIINISAIIFFLKYTTLIDNIFFRKEFLGFIDKTSGPKSAAAFIFNLNPILRVPLGFIFYFGSPFLSVHDLWFNHKIIIRSWIEQVFPFLFIFYLTLMYRFFIIFIHIKKDSLISILFITYLLSILILSQLSMQPRHKTMLMPIFYLLVAYGASNKNKISMISGFTIAISLFSLEILYNLI